jgi:hypothetical protein
MMAKSPYVVQPDGHTMCPSCHKHVDLLCEEFPPRRLRPWFYICWNCKTIVQLGVGPVRREGEQ